MPNLWLCHSVPVSFSVKKSISSRWRAMALHLDESLVLDLASPQALHLFAGRKQLVKLTLAFDAPLLHHHDPIGAAQGRAVRNHQAGQPTAGNRAALIQPFPQQL